MKWNTDQDIHLHNKDAEVSLRANTKKTIRGKKTIEETK